MHSRSLRSRWAWPAVVDERQIDLFYRGGSLSAVVGVVEAFVVSALFWHLVSPPLIAAWLVAFALVRLLRLPLGAAYRRARARGESAQRWIKPLLITAPLQASMWGLGSWVLMAPESLVAESALHVALLAVTLGSISHLANYFPLVVLYTLGVFVPLIARDLYIGTGLHLVLAAICACCGVYMILNGRRQAAVIADTHVQSRRNVELAEALQRENAATHEARQVAERANAAKSRFFAAANHDLRQPLHAMGLLAQTLRTQGRKADVELLSGQIVECVDSLAHIVDELQELSRIDTGSIAAMPAPFALHTLVREVAGTYEPAARAKGLRLEVQGPEIAVFSDRQLLARVLANLVVNAVRYTQTGTVRMAMQAADGYAHLHVEDTGIGIAADALPRIWDEFYQVGNPTRERQQGLGLGLATVKRLSDLLGLQVGAQSEPGRGSVFTLCLPLAAPAALPVVALPGPATADELLSGKSILVIEDDAPSAAALVQLLRAWRCQARSAPGADAAVDAVQRGFRPDCVLADFRLGDGDGCQAIDRLRRLLGPHLPAALVTGDTGSERVGAAAAAGLAVLRKPVKPLQLRAWLNAVFAGR